MSAVAYSQLIPSGPTRRRCTKAEAISIPKPANERIRAVPIDSSRPTYVPSAMKAIATATRNITWPSSVAVLAWALERAANAERASSIADLLGLRLG